jgi:hypothetical protein
MSENTEVKDGKIIVECELDIDEMLQFVLDNHPKFSELKKNHFKAVGMAHRPSVMYFSVSKPYYSKPPLGEAPDYIKNSPEVTTVQEKALGHDPGGWEFVQAVNSYCEHARPETAVYTSEGSYRVVCHSGCYGDITASSELAIKAWKLDFTKTSPWELVRTLGTQCKEHATFPGLYKNDNGFWFVECDDKCRGSIYSDELSAVESWLKKASQ